MAKRKNATIPRRSLFDSLSKDTNLYCAIPDLANEAAVEAFFVNRMLVDLGYRDGQIKTKQSISELTVSLGGSKSIKYRPDFVLTYRGKPRWVIDAKHPSEDLGKWVAQCSGYCLGLNQTFQRSNPVKWFLLTNGIESRLYEWDNATPILTMAFTDFDSGNPHYEQLRSILSPTMIAASQISEAHTFKMERPTSQQAKSLFQQCHRAIWKSEGQGPTGAFMEFTKLMFVKLWCDRQLRQDENTRGLLESAGPVNLPKDTVAFSAHWIEKQPLTPSPVNDILFKRLRDEIEYDIASKKKKVTL